MGPNEINGILQECTFPGWQLRMGIDRSGDPLLQVRCDEGVCNLTGEPKMWGGRKWRLSWHMTPSEIVQTAFLAVMTAMEHEAREQFKYRGVAVMQPHRDLDALVKQAGTTSERAPHRLHRPPVDHNANDRRHTEAADYHRRTGETAEDNRLRKASVEGKLEGGIHEMLIKAGYLHISAGVYRKPLSK